MLFLIDNAKFIKQEHELSSISDKWVYFIKNACNLDHIPDNADTDALKQAYQIAEQHQWTRNELEIYKYQGLQIRKIKGAIDAARSEGEYEKSKQIVIKTYQEGMSLELIAKITDLSIYDLQVICES